MKTCTSGKTLAAYGEDSQTLLLRYELLTDLIPLGGGEIESYGIRVEAISARGKHRREVRHLTVLANRAAELLELCWRNSVTPVSLPEVLEDIL